MRLIAVSLAALGLLAFAPASASEALAELDLSLPQPAGAYRADPPGAYYGDTSGVPAPAPAAAPARRRLCPTGPDGEGRDVTGSLSTGIGYTSGYGSSRHNEVGLGYCKSFVDEEGRERAVNLQLHMGNHDGPGHFAPMHGARPPGAWPR